MFFVYIFICVKNKKNISKYKLNVSQYHRKDDSTNMSSDFIVNNNKCQSRSNSLTSQLIENPQTNKYKEEIINFNKKISD